jgi:hypothetical protein
MPTTDSHAKTPTTDQVDSLIPTEVLTCGGEPHSEEPSPFIESGSETEETAVDKDWPELES